MLSPFTHNANPLELFRFPLIQVNRSLQAWDAGDEYLLNYFQENFAHLTNPNIAIFNDAFGALTTHFCQTSNDIATTTEVSSQVYCINDSYISQQGIAYNIKHNQLSNANISQLTALDALPSNIDIVLYKIPKNKSLLTKQLIDIKNSASANTVFIAADRAKEIHSKTLKTFEQHLGTTTTSLAVKKARLVFCQLDTKAAQQDFSPVTWLLHNTSLNKDFTISNHANVYSREKLDIGARYFIENLPQVIANAKVIDLGCGNGVIGLTILASQPSANVQFVDESHMAIASAKINVEDNFPDLVDQCQFELNDCLTNIESNSVDLILCNPPFHQHTATTDHIAWQMFKDSHRVLRKGGELRIIGNRQLAYHIKLKRIFGNEKLVASNDKFVTQSAIKR